MGITQCSSSRLLRHITAFSKSFDVFPKLLIEAICHEGTSPPLKTDTSIILQKWLNGLEQLEHLPLKT
jgi:hypothetical protein